MAKLVPGQPLNVSIVLKWSERPDKTNAWTASVIQANVRHGVALGWTPGEAVNNALLHLGLVDTAFQPSESSGD